MPEYDEVSNIVSEWCMAEDLDNIQIYNIFRCENIKQLYLYQSLQRTLRLSTGLASQMQPLIVCQECNMLCALCVYVLCCVQGCSL